MFGLHGYRLKLSVEFLNCVNRLAYTAYLTLVKFCGMFGQTNQAKSQPTIL